MIRIAPCFALPQSSKHLKSAHFSSKNGYFSVFWAGRKVNDPLASELAPVDLPFDPGIIIIEGGKRKMDNGKEKEVLLRVWMRLADIRDLVSVLRKGLEAESETEAGELCSVMGIVNKLLAELIGEVDKEIE